MNIKCADDAKAEQESVPAADNLTVIPALRAVCPNLTPDELVSLEASLKAEGCRDAAAAWRQKSLPGQGGIYARLDKLFATRGWNPKYREYDALNRRIAAARSALERLSDAVETLLEREDAASEGRIRALPPELERLGAELSAIAEQVEERIPGVQDVDSPAGPLRHGIC